MNAPKVRKMKPIERESSRSVAAKRSAVNRRRQRRERSALRTYQPTGVYS